MDLEQYLNDGINSLVKDAMRSVLKNPRETAFLVQYGISAKKAEVKRHKAKERGEHIPSFLIASITNQCNLNCAGCYDRSRKESLGEELSRDDWRRIFREAEEIGISAILLAGGEPLLRTEVLEEASSYPSMLFPIFTNGTMLDDIHLELFDKHRQLIPIISIEGDETFTDTRRGSGIFAQAMMAINKLQEFDLLFGVSITVTSENLKEVTSGETILKLCEKSCKVVVFVEYVPFGNQGLVLDEADRCFLEERIISLRKKREIMFISFPGDEKRSGGCLAAGRGFFHINAKGNAEPCPFSPYSDTSLKTKSLGEALQSPLFVRLRNDGNLQMDHKGGCTLFEQAEYVKSLTLK